jgi:phosphotransferase system HPr (HPr) family protein
VVKKELLITNPSGLHTRPAKKIVDAAKLFESEITIAKGDKEGSAKNLIKLMKLGITLGSTVTLSCDGPDEDRALAEIESLIASLTE